MSEALRAAAVKLAATAGINPFQVDEDVPVDFFIVNRGTGRPLVPRVGSSATPFGFDEGPDVSVRIETGRSS